MHVYPYKMQVQIVFASIALHNYTRKRSQDDDVFAEYDQNLNLLPDNFLLDIVARLDIQEL